jgi:hypothetical protein
MEFRRRVDELGADKLADKDLGQFIFEFQTAGVKLAGALNGVAQDRGLDDPAFIVARLKRALNHLHKAQAGLEAIAPKESLPLEMITEARRELFEIREGILTLMNDFRG